MCRSNIGISRACPAATSLKSFAGMTMMQHATTYYALVYIWLVAFVCNRRAVQIACLIDGTDASVFRAASSVLDVHSAR